MILNNWSIVSLPASPYSPPETWQKALHGNVYEHPAFEDGDEITTSAIALVNEYEGVIAVTTQSGSEYYLGNVDPEYEAKYPDAAKRLLDSFGEKKA